MFAFLVCRRFFCHPVVMRSGALSIEDCCAFALLRYNRRLGEFGARRACQTKIERDIGRVSAMDLHFDAVVLVSFSTVDAR